MAFGLICITGCIGYIIYMRQKYENMGYRSICDNGEEVYIKQKSRWEK